MKTFLFYCMKIFVLLLLANRMIQEIVDTRAFISVFPTLMFPIGAILLYFAGVLIVLFGWKKPKL